MTSTLLNAATTPTIAIVGGGCSGALVATHLLKTATQPLTIKLIERSYPIGKGIAYSTDDTCHLLNVSAGNMSAFPNDPGHLLRWLQHNRNALKPLLRSEVNPSTFIPRKVYGLYIQSILAEAEATALSDVRLERLIDEVVAIAPSPDNAIIDLKSGQSFSADQVVLAVGNAPQPPFNDPKASYGRNAWSADALKDLDQDAPVLIIGTGLTMVDMVLSLHERQHRGKIYAVSRRGLFPQRHQATKSYPSFLTPATAPTTARSLLHRVRAEIKSAVSRGYDWRAVIDSLRPITQQLWQKLSRVEQRRFLLHVAPYWDVHRHRIAQQVANTVAELLESGQLTITAGRIKDYQVVPDGVEVTVRQRKTQTNTVFKVSRVVSCTGITADYAKFDHPLISSLRSQGLIHPNSIGLGLDAADNGALLSADGEISHLFYTLGTPRKGNLWETIAVPEIRGQAQNLAETLLQSLPLYIRSIPTIHPYYSDIEDS
ncbi:MAG: FAD/NAD(P)-binding protein, partial [Planktothrix agardhii]